MTDDNRNLPEWEAAFTEYARKDAPDLLPGILAKINAGEEPPLTVVSEAPAKKKPFWMRRQFLLSASAFAATLLLIAILLRIPFGISKDKDNPSAAPATDECKDDQPVLTISAYSKSSARDMENASPDNSYVSFAPDRWKHYLVPKGTVITEPMNELGIEDKTDKLGTQYSSSPSHTGATVENVVIADEVVTQKETLYRVVIDGELQTDILIRSDAVKTGDTYACVYILPTQEGFKLDNRTYLICTMVEKK